MVIVYGHNDQMESTVSASVFKAKCLAMLDDVAESGAQIIVTKHGRPVAKLVPIEEPAPTMGSVTLIAESDDDYFTTESEWHVDS
jgi:prevent-host-death family protein